MSGEGYMFRDLLTSKHFIQVKAFPLPDNVTWRLCWTLEAGESCHEEVVNVTMKAGGQNYITEADIILPLASVNTSLLNLSCVASNTWGRGKSPVYNISVVGESEMMQCLCSVSDDVFRLPAPGSGHHWLLSV